MCAFTQHIVKCHKGSYYLSYYLQILKKKYIFTNIAESLIGKMNGKQMEIVAFKRPSVTYKNEAEKLHKTIQKLNYNDMKTS